MAIGIVSGAFGVGYFLYGKKQEKMIPLGCGVGLIVLPYFLSNVWISLVVCGALVVLPFVVKSE